MKWRIAGTLDTGVSVQRQSAVQRACNNGGRIMPDATHDRFSNRSGQRADPTQLRAVFGANLRSLSASAPSIAGLCRELGINRTQFNRYLTGEAFPRPDVLHHICRFFDVDARILLEPLELLRTKGDRADRGAIQNGDDRLGQVAPNEAIDYARMPLGLCLIYRRSFLNSEEISVSMTSAIVQHDGSIGLMSIMPREIAQFLGMSLRLKDRKRTGKMYQHPTGISFAFKGGASSVWQFAFLEYSYLGNPNLYAGECLNTLRLGHPGRITDRILLERLKPSPRAMFEARAHIGYKPVEGLKPAVRGYFVQDGT